MNEALHCLSTAKQVAKAHLDQCVNAKANADSQSAGFATEIERMETRIKDIEAAIKKLGG